MFSTLLIGCSGDPVVRERIPTVTTETPELSGATTDMLPAGEPEAPPASADLPGSDDIAPIRATTAPVVIDDRTILLYAEEDEGGLQFLETLAGEFNEASDWKVEIVPKE